MAKFNKISATIPSPLDQGIMPTSFRPEVICPHCWTKFPVETILWISESSNLTGDSKLNEYEKKRFLPSAYTVNGVPLDAYGLECKKMACPHCHLVIPRTCVQVEPYFISIA